MSNPLQQLDNMIAAGMQPVRREIWLGIGFRPPKRCAIELDPVNLPTEADCRAVTGLDVLLVYHGQAVRYNVLRTLCDYLYRAAPRRLQLIDLDAKRVAFLKLMGVS